MLQWGHDLAVMERAKNRTAKIRPIELQWGHDLAVMESAVFIALADVPDTLQWGHDLAVMERLMLREHVQRAHLASMGP